jgi:uncharacterized repeat protein (TIGR01451 family)
LAFPPAPQSLPVSNGKIVYQKGPNASSDIYLITPGSGVSVGLRKGYHPAFSPDGTKIAFVDNTVGPTNGFIMLMNADGTNARSLVHSTQGFSPTWSPDGLRLAFVRGDFVSVGNDGKGDLYVMDMTPGNEGANEVLLPGTLQVSRPSWGSNNRIVFACMMPRQGGGNTVLGIRVTGTIPASDQIASNPPAITSLSGINVNDRDPSWSFDGAQIAFLSTRDFPQANASEIYVMDAQGSNVRRVTNASNFKTAPAWAPDGTQIVFSRSGTQGSNNADLALVNADGSNGTTPLLLTNVSSGDVYPNWGVAVASPSPSPVINLEITKTGPSTPVKEDDEFVYNVSVKNSNTSTGGATGVKVVDPLPNGVRFKRSSNQTCVESHDVVTCDLPDISVSDTRSVTLIVSGSAGIRNNQASVTANQHLQPVLSNIVKTTIRLNNDNFANAREISGQSGESFSSNVGATKEIFSMPCVGVKGQALSPCEPNHAQVAGHQSLWWKWTPSRTGTVYFNTHGSQPDTTLAAYAVYGGKLTERASNDDYGGSTSRISFKAFEGDVYYIAVDGYQDSAGDIFLHWSQNPEIKPSPVQAKITGIVPGFAKLKEVTNGSFNVRILGSGFTELSQVYVNGLVSDSRRGNRSVTPTEINVLLPANDLARIGTLRIAVCGTSDSDGGCGSYVSNEKTLNVIGYTVFEVTPGQITEVCNLDDGGKPAGMCFTTTATTCPGPASCKITPALYEAITVADLQARSVGTKFHTIGIGGINDASSIKTQIKVDEDPPPGSVAVGSKAPAGTVSLEGLLLGPPAPGVFTGTGSALLDYGSAKFTAAQFANSLKLIGNDGGTLIGNDGGTLIGNDGGTIMNRATGSFSYANALAFVTKLIGNDGGTFSGLNLAQLIGNDGGTLIGNDGGTLIGNDGGTLVAAGGGNLLGLKESMFESGAGNLFGNLGNPNQLLGNLHGVSFVNHNGGDLFNHSGGQFAGLQVSKNQSPDLRAGERATASTFDPDYKGWFMVSGSGGAVPEVTKTTDANGNASGTVNITFDNTSFPRIADVSSTVLTVVANPSIVQFSSVGLTVSEGAISATISVTRSGDATLPLSVRYTTADGSAKQTADYKATSGTLKFAVGETTRSFTVPIVDDGHSETTETITLTLRNADVGVLGPQNTATLTINDNDNGTPAANPIDTASFFVRQHYYDVFDRLPDQAGLDSRTVQITQCGSDTACISSQRMTVSMGFLVDAEFQETGMFINRVFKALLGRQPTFSEFLADRAKLVAGADLSTSKTDFVNEFLYRQVLIDPTLLDLTPEQFVDKLNSNSGGVIPGAKREAWVKALKGQYASLGSVLQEVADNPAFKQLEYKPTFVTMLYFTLLRRDPDSLYASRLQALNQSGNFQGLLDAFVNSTEYRARFGSAVCGFNLASAVASSTAGGGPGVVSLTSTASDCSRTAVSNVPWITITVGASGTGSGTVNYSVALNNGSTARSGTITIAGQTFTVNQAEPVWDAIALTAVQAEIKAWTSGGTTYAYLKLLFPNAGYRVANWGQATRSGNDFTADATVEKFTGGSVQAVTTTAGIYDLGALAPGSYKFTFNNSGNLVKTVAFSITAPPFPANTNDSAREFVKQQYLDFLNREADQAGEDFWTDNIAKCADPARRPAGQTEAQCTLRQRETTSGAFFLSPEFQYTGYYVLRMYQGVLGRQPKLSEFLPDAQFVGNGIVVNGGLSAAKINQNKADLAAQFVNCTDAAKYRCAEFKAIYDGLTNQQYVDKLFETTGVNASAGDRTALVYGLNGAMETRATVLQKVVDGVTVLGEGNQQFTTTYGHDFYDQQFTKAFVQLEYFGYMKRDPDEAGYNFWLGKLNQFGGNFVNAEMVLAFISSPEYRARFGQP